MMNHGTDRRNARGRGLKQCKIRYASDMSSSWLIVVCNIGKNQWCIAQNACCVVLLACVGQLSDDRVLHCRRRPVERV